MHDELWSELLSEASKHRSDGNELSDAGSDIEADSVEKNTAELVRKPAKAEDRLTKAQRNKRQRVRELEKTIQENKEEKAKIKQINKVKAIASDVLKEFKEKEDRRLELAEKRSNRTVDEIAQLTRVGNEKFELPIPDVPFTDELKGSVRLIQPQSSLIKEEFINLQRTGVIEPRKPKGQKRRYPQKYYNRWTVQD